MAKIIVFKKNSPWGILKVPMKGNLYRHVIDFLDPHTNKFSQILKDEFVNNELCDDGKTLDQMFLEAPKNHQYEPINEILISFSTSPDWQRNRMDIDELSFSDICCVQKNGKNLFYTLKVVKMGVNQILFEAELDIFFSFNIEFREGSTNQILNGHCDRWTALHKQVNYEFMMNQEPELNVSPALHDLERPIWYLPATMNSETQTIYQKIKWMVIYLKDNSKITTEINTYITGATFQKKSSSHCSISGTGHARPCKNSDYEIVPNSGTKIVSKEEKVVRVVGDNLGSNIRYNDESLSLPYQILIVPLLENHKVFFQEVGSPRKKFSLDFFQAIFNDNDALISVHLLDSAPYRFCDDMEIKFVNNELDFIYTVKPNLGWHFNNSGYFVINNFNLLKMVNISQVAEIKNEGLFLTARITNHSTENIGSKHFLSEPKLWFHQFYNLSIKTWNGESKKFYPYFLKDNFNGNFELNKIYTFQPEAMNEIIYFEGSIYQDNLHLGNILNQNIIQEIPSKQGAYVKYMRENKNQIQTGIKYDKMARSMAWTSAILTIPAMNPVATMASIYSAISSQKSLEMRESKMADIQNILPNVNSSNNLLMNMLLNKTSRDDVIVSRNSLIPEHKEIVFNHFTLYGYTIKSVLEVEKFKNSRYRYNYIKAVDIFNTIKNKFSPLIKEKIASAFGEGITFWHYRKKENWKGILNHKLENWEMSVLKLENKT